MQLPSILTQATDFFVPGRNFSTDAKGRRIFRDVRGDTYRLGGPETEEALRKQTSKTVVAATGWMVALYLGVFLAQLPADGLQQLWAMLAGAVGGSASVQASVLGPIALMGAWVGTVAFFGRGLIRAGREQRELLCGAAQEASMMDTMVGRVMAARGGTYQQGFYAWLVALATVGMFSTGSSLVEGMLGSTVCVMTLMVVGQGMAKFEARRAPASA